MSGDPAALAAEVERLRALVGPNEERYVDLQHELEQASAAVRAAELSNGRLRGEITELRVELRRARQDQYHVWKLFGRPTRMLRALKLSAESD